LDGDEVGAHLSFEDGEYEGQDLQHRRKCSIICILGLSRVYGFNQSSYSCNGVIIIINIQIPLKKLSIFSL
jgi:hypothetical protein